MSFIKETYTYETSIKLHVMIASVPLTKTYSPGKHHPFLLDKFKRRDPESYFYLPIHCPFMKHCTDGSCPLSHTKLEVIFHPIIYKTRRCKTSIIGMCSFSYKCTFYHEECEKRTAQRLWLAWENTWNLWRVNIENVLWNHNKLSTTIVASLTGVMNYHYRTRKYIRIEGLGRKPTSSPDALPDCMLRDYLTNQNYADDEIPQDNPLLCFVSNSYLLRTNSAYSAMIKNIIGKWFFNNAESLSM